MADPEPPAQMYAVLLLWLSGLLFGIGGIVLGLGLGGFGGLLTGVGGVALGLLMLMVGVFGVTSHGSARSRFNLVTLAGPLLAGAGLVLGWRVGGLAGVGVAILLAALGAVVAAIGVVVGVPKTDSTP